MTNFVYLDLASLDFVFYRVCQGLRLNLNKMSEMITFESLLTTYEVSSIFRDRLGSSKNWLEPKIKLHQIKLSVSKFLIHTVDVFM